MRDKGTTAGHEVIFAKPQPINDVTLAFPARVMDTLMPKYVDIPDEFKDFNNRDHKWLRFQSDWFFYGLKNLEITPKEGIDKDIALRHLAAIQGSFEPKHEHKESAVAYLASLWFEDVKYEKAK